MVRDGIYYALGITALAVLGGYLWTPFVSLPLLLLAAFCLYFFRDPERDIPSGPVAVSPADGKIVSIKWLSPSSTRVSIFMNVFDVHVNRAPVEGEIAEVKYQVGRYLVASREEASTQNEQNAVTIQDGGTLVTFTQIAGLVARRIVFERKVGERVGKGERVGMIKFGSRVDVFFGSEWTLDVEPGQRVKAGSSILAHRAGWRRDAGTDV